jgi:aldose 1-epimerase
MKMKYFVLFLCAVALSACTSSPKLGVSKQSWGSVDGKEVFLFTLTNANGLTVKISSFGATINAVLAPDKNGKFENVVLGFDSLAGYLTKHPYFGGIIGRYGNRIAKGKFTLDSVEYKLATNNGVNHLHGGDKGFDRKVWDAAEFSGADSVGVVLTYVSADMEEGYPGTLSTKVTYVFNNANELKLYYEAETDKPTVLNLTNHAYFNLSGGKENILNHELTIYGDSVTPTDSTLIPTGVLAAVKGTGFDFTAAHKIGERIDAIPGGYDINYKLNRTEGGLFLAAEVYDAASGRLFQTLTTEPGIQFYSGNFLDGTITGSAGIKYEKHFAYCLESQHYPDSPNQPNFPSTVLRPGEKYSQLTIYKFGTK